MFDLTIYPLTIEAGREQNDLPGLLVAAAPRKAARIRAQDQLLLYWKSLSTPSTKSQLTPAQQQEILNRLAETYFTTSGSVTAGLRAVVARLNDFLLNRNLKSAQDGQWVGLLNLVAIHRDYLFVAHGGPTHSFVLSRTQVLHYNDGQGMRGLGLSRQAVPRFYQAELQPGDLYVICNQPPKAWTEKTLANSPQLSMDLLRRRLLNEAGGELQAIVVRFQEGKGQVNYWRPSERGDRRSAPSAPESVSGEGQAPNLPDNPPALQPKPAGPVFVEKNTQSAALQQVPTAPEQSLPVEPQLNSPVGNDEEVRAADYEELEAENFGVEPAAPFIEEQGLEGFIPPWEAPKESATESDNKRSEITEDEPEVVYLGVDSPAYEAPDAPLPSPRPALHETGGRKIHASEAVPVEETAPAARQERARPSRREDAKAKPAKVRPVKPKGPNPVKRWLASVWRKGSAARARVGAAFTGVAAKVFPERSEPLIQIPASAMLLVSVVVPLVVVAVATAVYVQTGQAEQYQIWITRAQQYALTARDQSEPVQQRESWNHVYELVRAAEVYEKTDETRALKHEALGILDELEGFVRLDYQPVVRGGLGSGVNITEIVPTSTGVYLLDSANSNVIRLINTSTGYDVDTLFRCNAGKAGSVIVGPLIDLAPLPLNNELRAAVVGIDANGTLIYCSTASGGFSASPLALPDAGWGEIRGITTLGNTLYVLDPEMRAVYWYGGQNGVYNDRPHLYFDSSIPNMEDVVDLAVDQEFLYLLHEDGSMTLCESSGFAFAPTRCDDPMAYGDSRVGYDHAPVIFAGSKLSQLQTTQPPDPSLFALDEANKAIYHLSLRRLNLQRQFRPTIDSDFPLPNSAPTAFAITQNRRTLMAFGDQLFFAPLP